jgi:hypothetical protein
MLKERLGERVEGYAVPVLNEREIRAAAGMLFLAMLVSYMQILFKGNFLMIKYMITIFLVDLLLRLFVAPRFAPSLILAGVIVRRQVPEYVGAAQKRFAWAIGLVLSSTMFVFLVLANAHSPITGISCMLCLVFLFFESAFGICLGCKIYPLFFKATMRHCPGGACDARPGRAGPKTSTAQKLVVAGSVAFLVLMVFTFNASLSEKPHSLFGYQGTHL